MLFNSPIYLFGFLPIVFIAYFIFNRYNFRNTSRIFLLIASILFYSYWNIIHLLRLILISLIFNYWLGRLLSKERPSFFRQIPRKYFLIFGISVNIAALGYFKYTDFFIENVNYLFGTNFELLHILLPIGISFFTFQEIAYLIDSYYGKTKEYSFINYSLFVTFFPQLIAGPIVHHGEMMPQFQEEKNYKLDYNNVVRGLYILLIGLAKKIVVADTFAFWATNGFDHAVSLTFLEAWAVSLSYTLQLYFDFSGYSDMAIGAALMFNIVLPLNFNSPYKALDIQDFWRRWHMTLSRFLRDYLYIPLGGNRKGEIQTYGNLFTVFLLGGLWHGAGWTFVVWGMLHGIASIIHNLWKKTNTILPKALAWFITFNFVNITWIFFRAKSFSDATKVLKGMFGMSDIVLPDQLYPLLNSLSAFGVAFGRKVLSGTGTGSSFQTIGWIIVFLAVVLYAKNSLELMKKFETTPVYLLIFIVLFLISIYNMSGYTEFIYFQF